MTIIARWSRGDLEEYNNWIASLRSQWQATLDCFTIACSHLNPFTSSFPKSYAYRYRLSRWKLNFQYRSSSPRSWLYESHRHWCSRIANYSSPSWKRNPSYHWTWKIPAESWWHSHLFRSDERKPWSPIRFSAQKGTAFSDEDLELFWIPRRNHEIFSHSRFCWDEWEIKLYFACYYYWEEADSRAGTRDCWGFGAWSE